MAVKITPAQRELYDRHLLCHQLKASWDYPKGTANFNEEQIVALLKEGKTFETLWDAVLRHADLGIGTQMFAALGGPSNTFLSKTRSSFKTALNKLKVC